MINKNKNKTDTDGDGARPFAARVRRSIRERLSERVRAEFALDTAPVLHQAYAGHWQRSEGAWSWYVERMDIGSAYPMRDCLRADRWEIFDVPGGAEIFPVLA